MTHCSCVPQPAGAVVEAEATVAGRDVAVGDMVADADNTGGLVATTCPETMADGMREAAPAACSHHHHRPVVDYLL